MSNNPEELTEQQKDYVQNIMNQVLGIVNQAKEETGLDIPVNVEVQESKDEEDAEHS